jgi:FkbM family methyltransferase
MYTYYYNNDKNFPIYITDLTKNLTKYTFLDNNMLWEDKELQLFFGLVDVNKRLTIVDIGAQSGLYTLYAKYLPLSTFYSFEPYKVTYDLLCDNIKLNNITNVKTYNIALSNKKGGDILNVCSDHNGLHTMGKNPCFENIKQIQIETDTLDNLFFENNIDVNFIKIDTEGFEYYILEGGRKTINKNKPIIQLEYNNYRMQQCNITEEQINHMIKSLGYKVLGKQNDEMIIIPDL